VCNHELLATSPPASHPDVVALSLNGQSTPRSKGRRIDDDQSGIRAGDQDMRLARLPTEPARAEPTAREVQQAMRREACANAVAHDRERIAEGLYDNVIHRLFAAGLQLQATCQTVDSPTQVRIETTIDLLDATIAELRKAIFSLH
jgi:signal transduction histidine kinase